MICGQVCGAQAAVCPREWKTPARAEDREQKRETVMAKLRPLVTTIDQRINVDFCEQCLFAEMATLTCTHEAAPDEPQICEDWEQPPPKWCPTRGKLVLMRGPKDE